MEDIDFIYIVKNNITMAQAAKSCGMSYKAFSKKAKLLGCFKTNQSGKGLKKQKFTEEERKLFLEEILNGKHEGYQTFKLKKLLFKFNLLKDECSVCGWKEKSEGREFTSCELHHKDGNSTNNSLENLSILCPNCHSLTKTYRFRRGKTNFEQLGRKLLTE